MFKIFCRKKNQYIELAGRIRKKYSLIFSRELERFFKTREQDVYLNIYSEVSPQTEGYTWSLGFGPASTIRRFITNQEIFDSRSLRACIEHAGWDIYLLHGVARPCYWFFEIDDQYNGPFATVVRRNPKTLDMHLVKLFSCEQLSQTFPEIYAIGNLRKELDRMHQERLIPYQELNDSNTAHWAGVDPDGGDFPTGGFTEESPIQDADIVDPDTDSVWKP